MSGNPDSSYISPSVSRAGLCCDNVSPDRCINFVITLDSSAVGLIFDIHSGAEPPGALFYRIDCDTIEYPVGSLVCLDGPGPHFITFCKPGSNQNEYSITSIPGRLVPDTAQTVEGCDVILGVDGLVDSTIIWEDVTSGIGIYDSLLSCTLGCDTVQFTSTSGLPSLIKYFVCGEIQTPHCNTDSLGCDTVYVKVIPPLGIQITPDPTNFCLNDSSSFLRANVTGIDSSYTYQWFQGAPSTGVLVGTDTVYKVVTPGLYSLIVTDSLYPLCSKDTAEVMVNFFLPPDIETPQDTNICINTSMVINATGTNVFNWFTINDTLCLDCDSITYLALIDETIYIQEIDTNGCISIDSFIIGTYPTSATTINDTICDNEMYTLPDGVQTNMAGTYVDTLGSVEGCDSVVTTNLVVHPTFAIVVNDTICDDTTYVMLDGLVTNIGGIYIDSFTTMNGCDSVITTNLVVNLTYAITVLDTICDNEVYILPDGTTTSVADTYVQTFATVNSCDSTTTTILTVHPTSATMVNDTICDNEMYTLPDGIQTNMAGTYVDTLGSVEGCDSVVTTNLVVHPTYFFSDVFDICEGDTLVLPTGTIITSDTIFSIIHSTINGCDSTRQYTVNLYNTYYEVIIKEICAGEIVTIGNNNYDSAGIYIDTMQSTQTCDSIVELQLTVNYPSFIEIDTFICEGESFEIGNFDFTQPGEHSVTLINQYGCDSLINLQLKVLELPNVIARDDTSIYPGSIVSAYTVSNIADSLLFDWHINNIPYCNNCETFDYAYFENSVILVQVTDSNSCKSSNEFEILIKNDCPEDLVIVPNIITPNGDGYNDFFTILNPNEVQIEVIRIFNRWGEMVFEAEDFSNPWNGSFRNQECNPGVFTYYFKGNCITGSSFLKKGNITLLK